MRFRLAVRFALLFLASSLLFAGSLAAQDTPSGTPKAAVQQKGFTWTETYEGSGNTDGFITDVNSTVGYVFNPHFAVDMGVPYYFIYASSTTKKAGGSSTNSIGNPYLVLTYMQKSSSLNYSSSLNGAIPAATTTKGLSTGRVTFDWNNHFDHRFDSLTPFLNVGIANSISDTRFFHRPFISLGKLAHFEAGPELDLGDKWSFTLSSYYILPWGQQTVFGRFRKGGSSAPIKRGVGLTRDAGGNFGIDYALSHYVDLSAGYSYSAYYVLNTYSFGIEVNMASLLQSHRRR